MALLAEIIRKFSSIKTPKRSANAKKRADSDEGFNSNSNSLSTSSPISSSASGNSHRQKMIQEMESRRRGEVVKMTEKKQDIVNQGKQFLSVEEEQRVEFDEARLSSAPSTQGERLSYPEEAVVVHEKSYSVEEKMVSLTTPFHTFGPRTSTEEPVVEQEASYLTAEYDSSYASSCLTGDESCLTGDEDDLSDHEAAEEEDVKDEAPSPRAQELQESIALGIGTDGQKEEVFQSLFILDKDPSQEHARQIDSRTEQKRDLERSTRSKKTDSKGGRSVNGSKSSLQKRMMRVRESRNVANAFSTRRNNLRRTSTMERVSIIKQQQKRKTSTQGLGFRYYQTEPTFAHYFKKKVQLEEEPVRVHVSKRKEEHRPMNTWVSNQINRAGLKKEKKIHVEAPELGPKRRGNNSKATSQDEVYILDSFHFGMKGSRSDRWLKSSAFLHTSGENTFGSKVPTKKRGEKAQPNASMSVLTMSDVTLTEKGHASVRDTVMTTRKGRQTSQRAKSVQSVNRAKQTANRQRKTEKSEDANLFLLASKGVEEFAEEEIAPPSEADEKSVKLGMASMSSTNYLFPRKQARTFIASPELQLDNSGANVFLRQLSRTEKK